MKGKILILSDDLFMDPGANTKIVFRICAQLRDLGYDVSVLGVARYEEERVADNEGIHLIHEPNERATAMRIMKDRLGRFAWLRYMLRPRTIWYRINSKQYTPFYLEARRWLKKHIGEYDAMIACCSPYYPLQLAAEFADRIPAIYYKIDPVATINSPKDMDQALATEANEVKWDSLVSRIIMQEVVYKNFMRLSTRVNAHKVVVAQFPNVRPLKVSGERLAVSGDGKVNLYFIGKFYATIRHPQYLFNLMEKLEGTGIMLHIVGPINYMGFDKEYIEKYFTNKKENIRFHGAVPPTDADALLTQADVLVHVGNAVDTLMPSKILDYISSGKPILNICKIRNCPTIPLMERYPIGLTIYEQSDVSDQYSVVSCRSSVISKEIVEQVKEFCITNKGKQIPYEQIERLYPECTIEYVGNQFDETIQEAINEFKTNKI